MKTGGKQKNLYMLALMLLIAAVALACVWIARSRPFLR